MLIEELISRQLILTHKPSQLLMLLIANSVIMSLHPLGLVIHHVLKELLQEDQKVLNQNENPYLRIVQLGSYHLLF